MSAAIQLEAEDLKALLSFFPNLQFDRREQIAALLHAATADFQAAPGSGKTTLLGAKLALMAAKWPYERRGICVLTHTNVARDEIEKCLKAVPHGEMLLAYPHYLGTIQSFVNRFLALPWLRAKGIEVEEIDDDEFSDQFLKWASKDHYVTAWGKFLNPFDVEAALRGVRYVGPTLDLDTRGKRKLPATGKCIERLRHIKNVLASEGRLRHDDMFAYAEQALSVVPGLQAAVAHRFPSVFIDEMQDTSDIQLSVLARIFDGTAVVQRFGDVNQSILYRGPRIEATAFPRKDSLEVQTSLRFGPEIAAVANSLKAVGGPIDGQGVAAVSSPILILYSDVTVGDVVARFGGELAKFFSQSELDSAPVKAVCAIKRPGNEKQKVGRHLSDYFPGFDGDTTRPAAVRKSIRELMVLASFTTSPTTRSDRRSAAARSAILLLIQTFGVPAVRDAATWRQLVALIGEEPARVMRLQMLALAMVKGSYDVASEAACKSAITKMLVALDDLVEPDAIAAEIPVAWIADSAIAKATNTDECNAVQIVKEAKKLRVQLATIAGIKGETHLATLVLESCRDRKYDLKSVLPYLCGDSDVAKVTDESLRDQLMNIFVAASRPRRLLAFAMHNDRASTDARKKLQDKGWTVADWTEPLKA